MTEDRRRRGKGFNDVRIEGDVAYLQITDRHGNLKCEALVDAADVPMLKSLDARWGLSTKARGRRAIHARINGRLVMLHRFLIGSDPPMVDHINGDPLDNRRSNLRVATNAENQRNRGPQKNNRSGMKGVTRNRKGWMARIKVDGKPMHLGTFSSPDEAARAYDLAAQVHHGQFARLNFPQRLG